MKKLGWLSCIIRREKAIGILAGEVRKAKMAGDTSGKTQQLIQAITSIGKVSNDSSGDTSNNSHVPSNTLRINGLISCWLHGRVLPMGSCGGCSSRAL